MSKSHALKHLLICFTTLILALPSLALPKYQTTKLPLPLGDLKLLAQADQEMIKTILALEVHEDSEEPGLYYFVPPFHIRQYAQGAASLMMHSEKIRYFAEALKLMGDRKKISTTTPFGFQERIQAAETRIQDSEEKLDDAIAADNKTLIAHFEKRVAEKKKALEDLYVVITKEKEALTRDYDERASVNLALTGYDVDVSQCKDSEAALIALKQSVSQASMSYGGYISFNSYAGFTKNQLDALREYKTKYMPHIKVTLLPLEELTFKPLTEMQYDPDLGSQSSKIFTRVKGAGDYLGTTIVLDTTVAGAVGMATHLPPFIVPVGISATFKQRSLPYDFELKCDFSSGFRVKGRADIKDGLIIYDNDITNTMKAEDFSDGNCFINNISGDIASAEYAAMKELKAELEKMHFHRSVLSYDEKNRYYQGMLEDIQQNRKPSGGSSSSSGSGGLLAIFSSLGFPGLAVTALSYASDFHWHTNIQDVENISKFKYEKRLKQENGYETVKHDMSPNFCLVYNLSSKAYDRCTEEEFKKAENMRYAMKEIQKSDECKDAKDIWECASNRDTAGLLPNRDSNPPQPRDNMLVNGI